MDLWCKAQPSLHTLIMHVGTVVAMDKEPGILKQQHKAVIEALKDQMERELRQHKEQQCTS